MLNKKIDSEFRRIISALEVVLPPHTKLRFQCRDGRCAVFSLAGQRLRARWVAAGWPRQVRDVLQDQEKLPDIVVASQMSPGARALLSREKIGWIDELGAAEFVFGSIVVSRTGRKKQLLPSREERWAPSLLAVAEALLCQTSATVEAMMNATGLSSGACTNALRILTHAGHLIADVPRGRHSARRIKDVDSLLEIYATAAVSRTRMNAASLEVGGVWQDIIEGVAATGKIWDKLGISWAATGAAAAAVMAPMITTLGSAVIYVAGETIAELEIIARRANLQPIEGGRLLLKPFPTTAAKQLATTVAGIKVAPWPRVYADLRVVGVRGEDAAEHLREVIRGR